MREEHLSLSASLSLKFTEDSDSQPRCVRCSGSLLQPSLYMDQRAFSWMILCKRKRKSVMTVNVKGRCLSYSRFSISLYQHLLSLPHIFFILTPPCTCSACFQCVLSSIGICLASVYIVSSLHLASAASV